MAARQKRKAKKMDPEEEAAAREAAARDAENLVPCDAIKTGIMYREGVIEVRADEEDPAKRTYDVIFSTETREVERWFGIEVLDHSRKSVDLSIFATGRAPVLADHDTRQHIGVIEKANIVKRQGTATIRFGNSERAKEVKADVDDGIRLNVSCGYRVKELVLEKAGSDISKPVYRAVSWTPLEISSVPLGADMAAVIARDSAADDRQIETAVFVRQAKGMQKMDPEEEKRLAEEAETRRAADAAAAATRAAAGGGGVAVLSEEDRGRAVKSARDGEVARVKEIQALGDRHGQRDLAATLIQDGTPIDRARGQFLAAISAAGTGKDLHQSPADLGMSPGEAKRYSLSRAILAAADGNWKGAGLEQECSQEVAKRLKREPEGFFVPLDHQRARLDLTTATRDMLVRMLESRALDTATAGAAAELVATDHLGASFIELLRNMMVVRSLGATVLSGLVGDVSIPKQIGAGTAAWVNEGIAPAEGALATAQIGLAPKTLSGFQEYTRKLLLQSDPSIDALVRNDLAQVIALAWDLAAINGSGVAPEPRGILNTSGIGVVAIGANGGVPTWPYVVGLETEVDAQNALFNRLSYLGNAKVRGKLKTTVKEAGTAMYLMGEGGTVNGYPSSFSNQVPSNLVKGVSGAVLSALIFGNWGDLLLAEWGVMDMLVNPYTKDTQRIIRVSASMEGDVNVRRAESFSAITDMDTV